MRGVSMVVRAVSPWKWSLVVAGLIVLTVVAWQLWPEVVEALLAKEGVVEQLSHVFLLAGAAAWLLAARGPPRLVPFVLAAFSLLVWLEEIDWGATYGAQGIGQALERALGDPNLHNAGQGFSYVLFGIPPAFYFAAPSRWMGPYAPMLDERISGLGLGLRLAMNGGQALSQEGLEALLYATLLCSAVRCLRQARSPGSTAPPPIQ